MSDIPNHSKTAFILATGASILRLSEQEKAYLNQQPYTLAMNRYLLYYERVGILPKDLFLYDFSPNVFPMFVETAKKAKKLIPRATYYVNQGYTRFFRRTPKGLVGELLRRYVYWKRSGYWMPLRLARPRLVGIQIQKIPHPENGEFYWGNNLDQPLLHYRGSLTTAINLASIIYAVQVIKLIGVDLDTSASVDDGEYDRTVAMKLRNIPIKDYAVAAEKLDVHPTALPNEREQSIAFIIPKIRNHLLEKGIQLTCCNASSLLVKKGLCSYASVIEI